MKKWMCILIISYTMISCGHKQNYNDKISSDTDKDKDCIEVLYFHTKKRCITCNAIESLTKEVIDTYFTDTINKNRVIFKVINISTKEGEKIADKYEVTWSSLFVNKWVEGKESVNNMTDFAFSFSRNSPDKFKTGIKDKIEELQN